MIPRSGIEFEEYVAQHLRKVGYIAQTTTASHDFGADIVATDPSTNTRICIQTKFHARPIGNNAVQEVFASLAHYGADEGWVVTNSTFTDSAQILANENNIRLIDGRELNRLARHAEPAVANSSHSQSNLHSSTVLDADAIFSAASIAVTYDRVTARELKARLHISNEQAFALLDALEEYGIVSPAINGVKTVLIDETELEVVLAAFGGTDAKPQKRKTKQKKGGLFHRILVFLKG